MDVNTHFFDDKKDGQLITQIRRHEIIELLAKTFDENIDPIALLDAESKKDRMLARKLVCLMQLATQAMPVFLQIQKASWSTLYFRKSGIDEIAVEVLL